MKKRSRRYGKNRHGHKRSKYKKWSSMIMLICVKQHLSKIWSSIYDKVKPHWGWVEKKNVAYKKRAYWKSSIWATKELKSRV